MLPASRAKLDRPAFAAISRILAVSFVLEGSSSIAVVLMSSIPRVLGAVRVEQELALLSRLPFTARDVKRITPLTKVHQSSVSQVVP